jgi:hypothetical protein
MLSCTALVTMCMDFSAERAADGVAAEGQHQAGGFAPPDAQIENLVEAAGGVGELSLVNDESGVEVAGENLGNDADRRERSRSRLRD